MSDEKLITKAEAAEMLNVSERTISNWMRRKIIPAFKFGKERQSEVRFRRQDILDRLNASYRVN